MASLTGKKMTAIEDTMAVVRCSRIEGRVSHKHRYIGFSSCTAANLGYGGPSACQYACIGLGECAEACPFDALERSDDGTIRRHNLRCVSCKSCALACPFGTIYAELLPFYSMDYQVAVKSLVGGASAATFDVVEENERSPLTRLLRMECDALDYGEVDPGDSGIHIIDEHLAARVQRWVRKEVAA